MVWFFFKRYKYKKKVYPYYKYSKKNKIPRVRDRTGTQKEKVAY